MSELAVTDDERLIRQALAGHSESYGQLVLKYQDRLFNTVVQVVGHAEDARDIVQESLVQAFLKLESFRCESAFFTWLYRIAFNVAMCHQRRRRPSDSVERLRESGRFDPTGTEDGPAENLERLERCAQVQLALARLSEEHRAVLVLREIDGCCYDAIAEVLNVPVGTVRSRLHRARLQMKQELQRIGEGESCDF
jgi:RNA polymerase sigma-70 factor (ECF subfamily)